MRRHFAAAVVVSGLAGCGPSKFPDTYASGTVQQADTVEPGVVVSVRTVGVSASGTVAGAAAGGIEGSQAAPSPLSGFVALGGSLVGGVAGSAVEHSTADTIVFEYIVRKGNSDVVSVTQKDKTPLVLGQKVLVIAGSQARVVPDYIVPPPTPMAAMAGSPSKSDAAPAAPADTRPAERVKADAGPSIPNGPAPETSPAIPAATPVAVPPMPAASPDAAPGHTS